MATAIRKIYVDLCIVLLKACDDSHCLMIVLGFEILEKPRASCIEIEIIRDGSIVVLLKPTLP